MGLNWSCFMHIYVWKGECDLWKSVLHSLCYPQNNLRASSSFGRLARLAAKAFLTCQKADPFFFPPFFILHVNWPTCCKYFMPKLHPFPTSVYCGFKTFPRLTEALSVIQICIFTKGSKLVLTFNMQNPRHFSFHLAKWNKSSSCQGLWPLAVCAVPVTAQWQEFYCSAPCSWL